MGPARSISARRCARLVCTSIDCFVVFFYGVFPDALKTLEEIDVRLHFLANWWDVFDVAEQDGSLDRSTVDEVRKFLHDPVSWSGLHGGRAA